MRPVSKQFSDMIMIIYICPLNIYLKYGIFIFNIFTLYSYLYSLYISVCLSCSQKHFIPDQGTGSIQANTSLRYISNLES